VHTNVKFITLVDEGVQAAACLVVLLKDEDFSAGFGQYASGAHPSRSTTDDDGVKAGRNLNELCT
jgi:hypothetical protein